MYSGTTFGKRSGNLIGVHQRIDRLARRRLTALLNPKVTFPTMAEILHFEGDNGPDGIKRKSPSVDEPWHFIDPEKLDDKALVEVIEDHRINLARALKKNDQHRAAFEAAWMAHAVVDGLTPAHHVPLGDMIEELFGKPHYERSSVRDKNVIKGHNRRDTLSKNWSYWGNKGIFMTHLSFELGIATAILGARFDKNLINEKDLRELNEKGYKIVFRSILDEVVSLKTYERYMKKGWTSGLGRTVKTRLIPLITKAVILGWYSASIEKASK